MAAVSLFVLLLLPFVCEALPVPVYGRYQTCVILDTSEYHNPFNYTEVCIEIDSYEVMKWF